MSQSGDFVLKNLAQIKYATKRTSKQKPVKPQEAGTKTYNDIQWVTWKKQVRPSLKQKLVLTSDQFAAMTDNLHSYIGNETELFWLTTKLKPRETLRFYLCQLSCK